MMLRRTVLQWLATAAGTLPVPALRAWAQTSTFPGTLAPVLRDLAALVLPSELGREGADRVATQFERWVRDYRPGAETDHGYGFPRLRTKPASPAPAYLTQLEALRPSLASGSRMAIEAALEQAGIRDLPRAPDGRSVIADLLSFYFRGSDANDLCYRAQIRRETCRGLDGSDSPPPPLKGAA